MQPPADRDRKQSPVLDRESPPRPWRQRLAIPVAVIMVVILAGGAMTKVTGPGTPVAWLPWPVEVD